jgi:hypothetical protein
MAMHAALQGGLTFLVLIGGNDPTYRRLTSIVPE